MSVAFTTHDLHPRDRIPFWVDVATQTYFRHGFNARPESFVASVYGATLGNLVLSTCSCGPCDVSRTQSDVSHDGIDDIILGVRLSGRSILSRDEGDLVVDPGTIYLQDVGRPLEINFLTQSKSIFVNIPRQALRARIGEGITGKTVSTRTPVAGLAAEFLIMLAARTDALEEPVQARLAEQALDLIALALTASDGTPKLSSPRASALLRLKMVINARLSDPSLKPADAAAAAGISVRYANDLLAEENLSIERYILKRRLARCRSALEDPLQAQRMIGEIAFSWGFSDHSHFTRRFRSEFGMSPGDCRRLLQERTLRP
jgi:AraC family transcriptional regulator, positive regulator of tynA and feaB